MFIALLWFSPSQIMYREWSPWISSAKESICKYCSPLQIEGRILVCFQISLASSHVITGRPHWKGQSEYAATKRLYLLYRASHISFSISCFVRLTLVAICFLLQV